MGTHINDPGLLKEIGLPEDLRIVAPIVVGHPKRIPDPPERNEPHIIKVVS
jgi:hypothetical protein